MCCVIFGILSFLIISKILVFVFRKKLMKCCNNIKQLNSKNIIKKINLDLSETEEQYNIEAEIPGFNKEDIDVKIERDLLNRQNIIIKTVKKENDVETKPIVEDSNEKKSEEKVKYLIKERGEIQIERVIPLLQPINEESIVAKYEDGVLKITLFKLNSYKIKIE
jgi:HSP20 family protein